MHPRDEHRMTVAGKDLASVIEKLREMADRDPDAKIEIAWRIVR